MVQSINIEGILYFPLVRFFRKSLALPHFSVKDITKIDPEKLHQAGFKGLVFDKDNTITAPYADEIYPTITEAFDNYRQIFGKRIAIMSNSAGTKDDEDYADAEKIEKMFGIKVLRHNKKKPGGIDAVLDFFKCSPHELVMFGDRIFTDIVFGNRYGMLTVHTALLTEEGDNKSAAKVRKYELPLIQKWNEKGIKPPEHILYDESICLERLM